MPFIGQQPVTGAYHKLDAITTSATATYNLLLNGGAYSPASANHLLVSLNGVIQAPQDSFTVSGSTIIFDSALTSSDNIDFIMAFGDVLSIGTPSDGTVTTGKIVSGAVTDAKIASGISASKLTGALPAISGAALTGIAQDYVLLSTQTEPTAAGTFTLTLNTTGTYSEQIFVVAGWYQVNLVDTYLRTIESGSAVTGGSDYQYLTSGYNVAATPGVIGDNSSSFVRTNWYATGDSANETNDLIIHVRNAESTTQRTMITGSHCGLAGNANMTDNRFVGRRASAAAATAIQLLSNNASSNYVFSNGGYIKHYGVK